VKLNVRTATSDGEPVAVIEVSDSGPGFPPEFLPHAFERFRRADPGAPAAGGAVWALRSWPPSPAHGGRAGAENHSGGAHACGRAPSQPISDRAPGL